LPIIIGKKASWKAGLFAECAMSEKLDTPSIGPRSRDEIAFHINKALKSSDIVAICRAIGDATRLHNISDVAKKARIERPSVYRAFAGQQFPNLSTVLSVLDAMGFQLKVTQRRGQRAKLARTRNVESAKVAEGGPTREFKIGHRATKPRPVR
jgi:probable addiction module antidote protein